MVWQETADVAVIVMLTKTFEMDKEKCFQYFPEKLSDEPWVINGDDEFGDGFKATIKLLEKTKDKRSSCTVRKISLKVGDKEKIVWHLLFTGWPDFHVPEGENRNALLETIKLANEKNSGPHNPLIVHCWSPSHRVPGHRLTLYRQRWCRQIGHLYNAGPLSPRD
jgi:protein-tyrosine phosphatase